MTEAPKEHFISAKDRTSADIKRTINRNIATKLETAHRIHKQGDQNHILFAHSTENRFAGDMGIISVFKDKDSKGFPEGLKGNVAFPFHGLFLNADFYAINEKDGKILKTYIGYFFNKSGQAFRQTIYSEDKFLNSDDNLSADNAKAKANLPKISFEEDMIDRPIYTLPTLADYKLVKKWLKNIEEDKARPIELPRPIIPNSESATK